MAKTKAKPKTAIYHPPKEGMPYMVVTVSSEGVTATAVASKEEARILASRLVQDNAPKFRRGTKLQTSKGTMR